MEAIVTDSALNASGLWNVKRLFSKFQEMIAKHHGVFESSQKTNLEKHLKISIKQCPHDFVKISFE